MTSYRIHSVPPRWSTDLSRSGNSDFPASPSNTAGTPVRPSIPGTSRRLTSSTNPARRNAPLMCPPPSSSRRRTPKCSPSASTARGRSTSDAPGHDVGDLLLPQRREVLVRGPLADDADQVVAVEIPAGPAELSRGVHGDGVGLGLSRDVDRPRPGRRSRLRCDHPVGEVLLHRRAAADPGVAVERLARGLVLARVRHGRDRRVDPAVDRRHHVADDVWPARHGFPPRWR